MVNFVIDENLLLERYVGDICQNLQIIYYRLLSAHCLLFSLFPSFFLSSMFLFLIILLKIQQM